MQNARGGKYQASRCETGVIEYRNGSALDRK
jgi:hypothetical protein